jgi:riboflavin kinase/FMN adenylyltransferase
MTDTLVKTKVKTRIIRSLYNIRPQHQGGVLTIGNFDGLHLGHQQLIAKTLEMAKSLGLPSIVVTFEPHASEYFAKMSPSIPRLTRLREKVIELLRCGIDYVLILPFNQKLANLSANDFITELYQALQPKHMFVGDDFRFGRQRQGDIALLKIMGEKLGFSAESLPTFLIDGERVSSTRVRKALMAGDHELAQRLLGRPYSMQGRVRHGDKLGRQLGFPTANIYLHRKMAAVSGIYAVLMHGIAEQPLPGAANVGTRPTVDGSSNTPQGSRDGSQGGSRDGSRALLEVHLLDFNQEIYGRYVQVEFCKKLREEERYSSLELLREQIAKDVAEVRDYFSV